MATFFDEVRKNKVRSSVIIFFFFVFVLALGGFIGWFWLQGGAGFTGGVILALIVGGLYFLIAWFAGSGIVLSTTGARPAT